MIAAAVGGCGYTTTTALLPAHIKKGSKRDRVIKAMRRALRTFEG